MSRARLLPLAAAALAACVTVPPPLPPQGREPYPGSAQAQQQAAASRQRPAASSATGDVDLSRAEIQSLDPKAYAAKFDRPFLCEEGARRVHKYSKDKGWAVLRSCAEKGNFTPIKPLLDSFWEEDLRTRPDASMVLLRIVAARGGDVQGDLDALRRRKIPLWHLGAATEHPEIYKGRMLMVRAEVGDIIAEKNKVTLKLVEKGFTANQQWSKGTYRSVETGPRGTYMAWSEKRDNFNTMRETGLTALAQLKTPDPFLVPGRDFLFLARFDGVRETDGDFGDNAETTPVISIITYIEPAAQVVE